MRIFAGLLLLLLAAPVAAETTTYRVLFAGDDTGRLVLSPELRDKIARLNLQLESADRGRAEQIETSIKAFELSQDLRAQWVTANYAAKRRILEITCLNFSLDGVTLNATIRKPFDMLAEGLVWKNSRGDWI